jgi:hypothetical protein
MTTVWTYPDTAGGWGDIDNLATEMRAQAYDDIATLKEIMHRWKGTDSPLDAAQRVIRADRDANPDGVRYLRRLARETEAVGNLADRAAGHLGTVRDGCGAVLEVTAEARQRRLNGRRTPAARGGFNADL